MKTLAAALCLLQFSNAMAEGLYCLGPALKNSEGKVIERFETIGGCKAKISITKSKFGESSTKDEAIDESGHSSQKDISPTKKSIKKLVGSEKQ